MPQTLIIYTYVDDVTIVWKDIKKTEEAVHWEEAVQAEQEQLQKTQTFVCLDQAAGYLQKPEDL